MRIVLLILVAALLSGCVSQEKAGEVQSQEKAGIPAYTPLPRKDVSPYLGVWMPSILYPGMHSTADRESLTALGANTVGIGVEVAYTDAGKFDDARLRYSKEKARELIRYYKEADLAVILSLVPVPVTLRGEPGPIPASIREEVLKNYAEVVLDLARIAEEENVEIFCPMDEPDYKLGSARGSAWGQEILPGIRQVYSGKVLWKGSLSRPFRNNERIDFSGYDIVGFTVFPWAGMEGYPQDVEFYISTMNQWADEDGVKERIVAEFGNYVVTRISKDEEPEAVRTVFEAGQGKVDGFILLDPPKGFGTPIKGSALEDVVKTWFGKLGAG